MVCNLNLHILLLIMMRKTIKQLGNKTLLFTADLQRAFRYLKQTDCDSIGTFLQPHNFYGCHLMSLDVT